MKKNITKDEKLQIMKDILKKADEENDFEKAKKEFSRLLKDTDSNEIAEMEQQLIKEGYPIERIQNLCDLHVSVFESSLKKKISAKKLPGHPINTFILENRQLKKILQNIMVFVSRLKKQGLKNGQVFLEFKNIYESLIKIENHYLRKENQLFPYLEKKGFTGPSKVMWHKDDEIRSQIKEISNLISNEANLNIDFNKLYSLVKKLAADMKSMIFKEEKILFPIALKRLTDVEWFEIKNGESHIGYSWIIPGSLWDAYAIKKLRIKKGETKSNMQISKSLNLKPEDEKIKLDTGLLNREQLKYILVNLPIDISFVDENDKVAFYSNNKDRIFPRSPAVIGREVQNCHPPKSVDKVLKILDSFKKGEKDKVDFWINLNGKMIYISYFAIRDEKGKYLGTLEVSQDITRIKQLNGEKRLLDF